MKFENRSSFACCCQINPSECHPGSTFEDFLLWDQTSQDNWLTFEFKIIAPSFSVNSPNAGLNHDICVATLIDIFSSKPGWAMEHTSFCPDQWSSGSSREPLNTGSLVVKKSNSWPCLFMIGYGSFPMGSFTLGAHIAWLPWAEWHFWTQPLELSIGVPL